MAQLNFVGLGDGGLYCGDAWTQVAAAARDRTTTEFKLIIMMALGLGVGVGWAER